jgi:ubiquinone/menaquinone biosynthesis C-methylase UbiE
LKKASLRSVPPSAYDESYYLQYMDGASEFLSSQGQEISWRLDYVLKLAQIQSGNRVLEIGCGRGEATWQSARQNAYAIGLDFSSSALQIAAEYKPPAQEQGLKMDLLQGIAYRLPFSNDCFDVILLLDVVEHLYPEELQAALAEAKRVLSPGGSIILHTMPNTWYYKIGYPIFRCFQGLRSKPLPSNPRDRWGYPEVHVNEQDLILLRRELRAAGFKPRVWLHSTESYTEESNKFVRLVMRALVTLYPFRWFFCNDLFANANK